MTDKEHGTAKWQGKNEMSVIAHDIPLERSEKQGRGQEGEGAKKKKTTRVDSEEIRGVFKVADSCRH